jgi:hypothetical protein
MMNFMQALIFLLRNFRPCSAIPFLRCPADRTQTTENVSTAQPMSQMFIDQPGNL